jgi:hypothetical protein
MIKKTKTPSSFPLYTHREIVYTCLNKLDIEKARTTCRNTIRLHRGLFNWTKCTKENESILLMFVLLYLFLYSYNFLFQIQSSSSTDSPAKSRSRGSRISSLYNVVIFPRRGPRIYIKHVHQT